MYNPCRAIFDTSRRSARFPPQKSCKKWMARGANSGSQATILPKKKGLGATVALLKRTTCSLTKCCISGSECASITPHLKHDIDWKYEPLNRLMKGEPKARLSFC